MHGCTCADPDTLAPTVPCHRSLVLSGPSRPPVSEPLRFGARQRGDKALRLQCTSPYTAERHTGWTTEQLAQDHGDGSSLGATQGREWHKDRQDETTQCLEYQIHWQVQLQTVEQSCSEFGVENTVMELFRGFCNAVSCELVRSGTPVCTGSV